MNRHDSVGMFWHDVEVVRTRAAPGPRPMPAIPDTGWQPPREFPRLDSAPWLCIDTETKDTGLTEHGPGWARGAGHIVGLAVGVEDRQWYFPMRHEVEAHLNMDPDKVLAWARDTFGNARQPKVFANAVYDLGWLNEEGVKVAGDLWDVQIAEPLLDEYGRYSLDALSSKYLGEGKVDDALYAWCAEAYGGEVGRKQAGNIYRAPPQLVGPYAEADVRLPPLLWPRQKAELERWDLWDLYLMESKLPRLLEAMRRRGVRFDVARAHALDDDLTRRIRELEQGELRGMNVNAPTDLERYAKRLGLAVQQTEKGNPSFAGKWVEQHMPLVGEMRKLLKMRDTFIRGYLFEHAVGDRIHCQFNALRSDEYGTVSGRFSSSQPNLQNIPARDEEWGPLIRGLYIPDEGHPAWKRYDWSQIEYRYLTHYARGPGAETARALYRDEPRTDFHVMAAQMVFGERAHEMRKPTKNINFGLVYGMGEDLLAETLARPMGEVQEIITTYHERFPFVKATYNLASRRAKKRGYIRTILKRLARFPQGESTHKALNRLLQGSAADTMKRAMVDIWESGVCDVIDVPHLTVHDELDWSDAQTPQHAEAFEHVRVVMETCVPLKVPLLVSMETGTTWGDAK